MRLRTQFQSQSLPLKSILTVWHLKSILITFGLLSFSIFRFAGPYEGSQVGVGILKIDWWGLLTPLVPEFLSLGTSRLAWISFYSIIILLLLVAQSTVVSMLRIEESTLVKVAFISFQYLSALYVLTNGRDGLAYFLVSLCVALLRFVEPLHSNLGKFIGNFLASICLVAASLFKITILPIAILTLLIYRFLGNRQYKKNWIVTLIMGSLIMLSSFYADSNLVRSNGLSKSYPAQQVMLYDFANVYCWSQNQESRSFAGQVLDRFRSGSAEDRTLCASAAPYGWDLLRLSWVEWSSSAPVKKIVIGDEYSYEYLSHNWIQLIRMFPEEWFESKVNHIGQVLFMSNIFYAPIAQVNYDRGILDFIIWLTLLPANFLDSLLLTSLVFAILLSILIGYKRPFLGFIMLITQLFGLIVSILTFVANNGRYTFSTTLLSYLVYLSFRHRGN